MTFVLSVLVLALMWAAITDSFTMLNFLFGLAVAGGALFIMRNQIAGPKVFGRLGRVLALAALFFYELVLSAFRVAVLVIRPNLDAHLKPGIIAFPLSVETDIEIALLANLITLTPGTLSVDVSQDRKTLFVHALAVPDKESLVRDIAEGFEAKIHEVFK